MGHVLGVLLGLLATSGALAQVALTDQDIDLFMVNPGSSTAPANVLILLDNTANWNIPFGAEKQALVNVVSGAGTTANPGLSEQFNVGLMLFPETGSPNDNLDGGYVRFAVRNMDDANKAALSSMAWTSSATKATTRRSRCSCTSRTRTGRASKRARAMAR